MANTTNGLPYPIGTDRVMDGDDAIRSLAQALDPAWTNLVLKATFAARATFYVPAFRVIAGVIHMRGQIQKSANFAQGDNPFDLPVGARPTSPVSAAAAMSTTSAANAGTARLDMAVAGGVVLGAVTAATPGNWISLDGVSVSISAA